jgi:RNA polymerase sigma-70 factor (ECF subfamily)
MTRNEVRHFTGLLFTVARNAVAAYYKEKGKLKTVPIINEYGEEIPIHSPQSPKWMIDRIDVSFLQQKIKELDEADQEIIILRYLEGYSVKEIAKYFGKTDNATSVMLHRALQKLKDLYERT